MARKKQEIALQVEIETQEEWEEMLAKEGLTVVDIYQEWAGPCKAMLGNFRRLRNELGDDNLRFSVAKADTIDALERYRGKCEPCFLFFAGGVLVAQVRGANSPLILRTMTEQLAYEHKVLEGNAERREIKDPLLLDTDVSREEEEEEEEEERKKSVSVAIIKPNVVADGKVDEVMDKIREAGIEILEQQEKTLTEEEARTFYGHKQDEEYFEDLVTFMTSGPSHVLVITKGETGEGIIEDWRQLLGPASVEEAKETDPESLRAQFGGQYSYVNALHGSDSQDTATRELAFFFPAFAAPKVPGTGRKLRVQRTLALIRPDALRDRKDEILAKVEEAGFKVAMQKEIQLTKEQAGEFYKEHKEEEYFEELTNRMSCGPLLALALAREDAITGWKDLLGPKEVDKAKEEAPDSLRAQFAVEDVPLNQLHGSDSDDTAKKELEYFFPMQQTVAVIKPDAYQTKDEIMDRIREAGFHIAARKETELTKDIAQQFYKDQAEKEYFGDLTEHMASGPTLFMVLSREDAVDGWRSLIGPTDPDQAKQVDPNTLRAQYGTDVKSNAVHGSSTTEHAAESLKLIFGELEFNPDGTVVQTGDAQQDMEEDAGSEKDEHEEAAEEGDGEKKDEEDTKEDGEKQEEGEEKKDEDQDGEKDGENEDADKKSEAADDKKDEEDKKSVKDEEKLDDDTTKDDEKDGDDKKDDNSAEDTKEDDKTEDKKDDAQSKTSDKAKTEDKKDDDTESKDGDKADTKTEDKQDEDSKHDDNKDATEVKDDDADKKNDGETKDDGDAKDDKVDSETKDSDKKDETDSKEDDKKDEEETKSEEKGESSDDKKDEDKKDD